jgi:hypothetical protein
MEAEVNSPKVSLTLSDMMSVRLGTSKSWKYLFFQLGNAVFVGYASIEVLFG